MNQEKLIQTIRKMVAERNAGTAAEREKIYAAARSALDRTAGGDPATIMELETAIAAVESSYAQEPKAPSPASQPGGVGRNMARVAMDVVLGALVAALVVAAALPFLARDGDAIDKLKYRYEKALPQIPVAVDFLHKVSEAIRKMQEADRTGIEDKASKRFIQLQTLDPELAKQQPASLPPGSSVILRADEDNYKILFNWPLCGAVSIAKPEMVDPVRTKVDLLSCSYFGIWTAGAAQW